MSLFKSKIIKKICVFSFVLILAGGFLPKLVQAEKVDDLKIDKYVNDFANIIDDNSENNLNTELANYDASTTNQIVVVTVNNLDDDYIEHYSIKLAEKIKAGTEARDNGVILLVAKDDRKMRIEVGYGLEGALTDIESNDIINNILKPAFQKEDYTGGIVNGTHAIEESIAGEYTNDSPAISSQNISKIIFSIIPFIFIIFIILIQWLASILGRTKSWWLGGIFGLFAGGIVYLIFATTLSIILIFIFSILGFIFDYFVSKNYKQHLKDEKKGPPKWWSGGTWAAGSSFWNNRRGGGWGGGSSGGFSGGGGSFGGGGSSGSW